MIPHGLHYIVTVGGQYLSCPMREGGRYCFLSSSLEEAHKLTTPSSAREQAGRIAALGAVIEPRIFQLHISEVQV